MCTPAAAITMQGAGALSSAFGARASASASQANLNYQADMADLNARMAETSAQATLITGQREEQKSMLATANLKSTQRAGMAANGVDLTEGSAKNVLNTTDFMGEIDANTIHANAIKGAWGHRVQATNFTNQANTSRAAASAINPGAAFTSSLLGSAGAVASSWYTMGKGATASPNITQMPSKWTLG